MSAPSIAIATGGREFWPTELSEADIEPALAGVVLVLQGEADGFDKWVRDQARKQWISVQPVPSLWDVARVLGMACVHREGNKRNARMLRWGVELAAEYDLPLILIAGPGGEGTADMRKRCADLPVREVRQ